MGTYHPVLSSQINKSKPNGVPTDEIILDLRKKARAYMGASLEKHKDPIGTWLWKMANLLESDFATNNPKVVDAPVADVLQIPKQRKASPPAGRPKNADKEQAVAQQEKMHPESLGAECAAGLFNRE